MQFTLEDIDRAHQRVTQATVRKYLTDLHELGVRTYTTHVTDGHSDYFDGAGGVLTSAPIHEPHIVSEVADGGAVKQALDAHGSGDTDDFAFSRQLAAAGAATWVMDPIAMTCAFYSKAGDLLLVDEV